MRVYLPLTLPLLEALAAGEPAPAAPVVPASADEADEFAALVAAAGSGPGALAAEVAAPDRPVTLAEVASFHVAVDDTGDLAWYAVQEIDAVRAVLRAAAR